MTTTTRKNITIDDIRQVLAGDDESEPLNPLNTNAHAIREILGRGSFGTIQKHLETIRNELTNTSEGEQEHSELPAPDGVVADLWKSACLMAQAHLLKRCDVLNTDRDRLREELELSVSDYQTALEEIDHLENTIEQKDNELAEAVAVAEEIEVLMGKLEEAHAQNATLTALIERTIGNSETDKPEAQAAPGRKQRTKITPEIEAEVKNGFDAGKKAADIADAVGISIGSVNKIKTKLITDH